MLVVFLAVYFITVEIRERHDWWRGHRFSDCSTGVASNKLTRFNVTSQRELLAEEATTLVFSTHFSSNQSRHTRY